MSAITTSAPDLLTGKIPWSAFKSMAWKEFRQNLPVLGIFVIGMILTLAMTSLFKPPGSGSYWAGSYWAGSIWMLINFFALTMGVFLFAPEEEKRTRQLLGQLPMTSLFAVRMKLWVGCVTVGLFYLIGASLLFFEVFVLGAKFSMGLSADYQMVQVASLVYMAVGIPLECFLWGALCSMLMKRAIYAVMVAFGCLVVGWAIPLWIGWWIGNLTKGPPEGAFEALVVAKVLIYLVLGFGLVYSGSRWLGTLARPSLFARPTWLSKKISRVTPLLQTSTSSSLAKPSASRIYCSLIWQSLIQYRSVVIWSLGCGIPFLLVAGFAALNSGGGRTTVGVLFLAFVPLLIVTLIGSLMAFSKDHEQRNYRFFQQHREYGRKLWLSRLIPAGIMAVVCAGCLVGLVTLFVSYDVRVRGDTLSYESFGFASLWQKTLFSTTISIFTAFAIGQFCSMFFRSSIFSFVAMATMVAMAAPWIIWLVLLDTAWRFFLPIPLSMLVITWWRAPRWLADQSRIRDYAVSWLSLGVVVIATVGSFIHHRYSEIPIFDAQHGNANAEFIKKFDDQKNLIQFERPQLFQKAAEISTITESQIERSNSHGPSLAFDFDTILAPHNNFDSDLELGSFIELNRDAIDLIHKTDELKFFGAYLDPTSPDLRIQQASKIRILIAAEARSLEWEGKLDEALAGWLRLLRFDREYPVSTGQSTVEACLIRWSQLPNQDVTRIRQAIETLSWTDKTWGEHAIQQGLFDQLDFDNWLEGLIDSKSGPGHLSARHDVRIQNSYALSMPWEIERSRKITNWRIAASPEFKIRYAPFAIDCEFDFGRVGGTNFPQSFERHSPFPFHYGAFTTGPFELFWVEGFYDAEALRDALMEIQRNRYAIVHMALAAWRIDHPNYPERLGELVPDYVKKLPVDVFYGGQFAYSPGGRDASVSWKLQTPAQSMWYGHVYRTPADKNILVARSHYDDLIHANTPFLLPWSTYGSPALYEYFIKGTTRQRFECYDYSTPQRIISRYMQSTVFPLKKTNLEIEHRDQ